MQQAMVEMVYVANYFFKTHSVSENFQKLLINQCDPAKKMVELDRRFVLFLKTGQPIN